MSSKNSSDMEQKSFSQIDKAACDSPYVQPSTKAPLMPVVKVLSMEKLNWALNKYHGC